MNKKVPVVLQDELYECGLACITSIANYHGMNASLEVLRNKYDITSSGLSLANLISIASDLGMDAEGYRLEVDELINIDLPCVVLWENRHFVVIYKVTKKKITIMDPAIGIREYSHSEFVYHFSNIAITFSPNEEFKNQAVDQQKKTTLDTTEKKVFNYGLKFFFSTFGKYKYYLIPLLVLLFISGIAGIATPKAISLTINEVIGKNDEEFLYLLMYIFGFLYFIQALSEYLKNRLATKLRVFVTLEESKKMMKSIFCKPMLFFSRRSNASILNRSKIIDNVHYFWTSSYLQLFVGSIFIVIFFVLLFFINSSIATTVLLSALASILVRILLIGHIKNLVFQSFEDEATRDHYMLSMLNNVSNMKSYSLITSMTVNWKTYNTQYQNTSSELEKTMANINLASDTTKHIQTLLIIFFGSSAVLDGSLTSGDFISAIFYKDIIMGRLSEMLDIHINLQVFSSEAKKLKDFERDSSENISQGEYESSLSNTFTFKSIELKDVSFGFTNLDSPILKNINLKIDENEKVALVGPSGEGKTTLLSIIAGMYPPTQGEILLNNKAFNRWKERVLKKEISIVSPDDIILDRSIIDNIILDNKNIDFKHLESVIRLVRLDEVISRLYNGVNTSLGVNGVSLSSGEKQRLFLARGLYRKPSLLILDEPTAHLDEHNLKIVNAALKGLKGTSIFLTSHNKETIKCCDRVLFLEEGKIRHE